ncbi:MAG TPA: 30S ribosomal protein S8 [Candidatus Hydrogenedentes bacterium]|jgi:small subunit ribosomal protein S8|nr:30S ribosomal protein S8 [Candidatus Hydrogenedentota bacterium]OQC05351.1 MAG: 30S ribosomal protein S8 [Candidatus Hydrogenedentes bacterium ADurb.Bin101]HOC69109.1 30S ribosomal protein S8 [Candidatus Hydrogenedentota bacterium]HQN01143.1 30S ribosomal protein S8 [Candidatus Hydrogenedentota bacterium]
MSMSDPIADMLTRMRNGLQAGKVTVDVPRSNVKVALCRVLAEQGYIESYEESEQPAPGIVRIKLRYLSDRQPVIQGITRVSKPSLRVYVSHDEINQVRSGLGISILSTSKGVMTGKQARKQKLGGELLCKVW